MRYRRSNHPGACLTPFVALPGFLTLSALCSPPDRPALFHAGNVLGVLPSELSPLEEPCRLSTAIALLVCPFRPSHCTTRTFHVKRTEARCTHPDSSGCFCLAPSHATVTCHLEVPPPRGLHRPGSVRNPAVSQQPTATSPVRACDRSRRPNPARPAAVCPGARCWICQARTRHPHSLFPDTSRGWPGLLSLAPDAKAPEVQNRDPVRPSTSLTSCAGSPADRDPPLTTHTPWFEPSGDAPTRC
jgi:hypothetical protein